MNTKLKSPTFLVKNLHSYCFRIKVPKDLQLWVNRKGLRYSLKTLYLNDAVVKSQFLTYRVKRLFRYLRKGNVVADLSIEQIQELADRFLQRSLEGLEDHYANADSMDWFEPRDDKINHINQLESIREDLVDQLREGSFETVHKIVDEVIVGSGIAGVEKESLSYRKLCREILKRQIKSIDIETNQLKGDFSEDAYTLYGKQYVIK